MQLRLKLIYYVRSPKGPLRTKKAGFLRVRELCNFEGRHASDPYMKSTFLVCFILSFLFLASGCQKSQEAAQHINVVMRKYSIEPAVIHVKAGSPVALDVTTADVQHGFDVPDLGIKEAVQPGKTTTIEFTPKAKGEYNVKCGVICGPHHDDMAAKLVVE